MHDPHPLRPDQPRQRPGIGHQRGGGFPVQRQGDVAAAHRLHLARHRAAGGGHQGTVAGPGDGLGDLHRAALHAAGMQRGQDLEDGGGVGIVPPL